MSDNYRQRYPSLLEAAQTNRQKNVSSSASFFQTMLEIGGVETPYRNDSLSVTSALFIERPRVYLNDHNEARTLDDVGMLKEDFKMLEENQYKIQYRVMLARYRGKTLCPKCHAPA